MNFRFIFWLRKLAPLAIMAWFLVGDGHGKCKALLSNGGLHAVVSWCYWLVSGSPLPPGECLPLPMPRWTLLPPPRYLLLGWLPVTQTWTQLALNLLATFALGQLSLWTVVRLLLHNHVFIRTNEMSTTGNKKRDLLWMALTRSLIFSLPLRPLTFTLESCLPLQRLHSLSSLQRVHLSTLGDILPPMELEALSRRLDLYFRHWTVRYAQATLHFNWWWRTNWAEGVFEQAEYLQHREPVPLKSIYCLLDSGTTPAVDGRLGPERRYLARAAYMTHALAAAAVNIRRGQWPRTMVKHIYPICMRGYHAVLGKARLPRPDVDEITYNSYAAYVVELPNQMPGVIFPGFLIVCPFIYPTATWWCFFVEIYMNSAL